MGQRYEEEFEENGDIIVPDFFVENMAALAGEFNSGQDRDNWPANTIATADIDTSGGRVFNVIGSSYVNTTEDPYQPDMNITSWQGGSGNGLAGIGNREFTLLQDGHIDIHWSGTWTWNGANYSSVATFPLIDTVQIRVTVDGYVVFVLGPFDDGADYASAYGCGSIQVPAGVHTLRVECLAVSLDMTSLQSGNVCTNAVTFDERTIVSLVRIR